MWTRLEIKTRAKAVLRKNYWRAFLVSLVLLLAGAGYANSSSGSSGSNNNKSSRTNVYIGDVVRDAKNAVSRVRNYGGNNTAVYQTGDVITTYVYRADAVPAKAFGMSPVSFVPNILTLLLGLGLIAVFFFLTLFRLFVGYGLEVGGRRYFINAAYNPGTDFKVLGMAFKGGNFFNVLSTMFMRSLYTFLWSLLFVIPGIIKSFEYSLIPYILADNPQISRERAFELSKQMTQGHKWEMFVLNLSFIGWYLLGSLCFGFGVIFVYPYENATKAELYLKLRDNTINSGYANCEELCLYPVYDYIDTTDSSPNQN